MYIPSPTIKVVDNRQKTFICMYFCCFVRGVRIADINLTIINKIIILSILNK